MVKDYITFARPPDQRALRAPPRSHLAAYLGAV